MSGNGPLQDCLLHVVQARVSMNQGELHRSTSAQSIVDVVGAAPASLYRSTHVDVYWQRYWQSRGVVRKQNHKGQSFLPHNYYGESRLHIYRGLPLVDRAQSIPKLPGSGGLTSLVWHLVANR